MCSLFTLKPKIDSYPLFHLREWTITLFSFVRHFLLCTIHFAQYPFLNDSIYRLLFWESKRISDCVYINSGKPVSQIQPYTFGKIILNKAHGIFSRSQNVCKHWLVLQYEICASVIGKETIHSYNTLTC